ncbi:MAG: beta-ketoacyl-[Victivallales bacterium]|nr:beta-ketoacyl-[acyl-carrier-protein] synthase family protein [Victivallales bacterium]
MASSILGIGIVSALGLNCVENRRGLYTQNPALPQLPTRFATELKKPVFEIKGLPVEEGHLGGYAVQMLDVALDEALREARLSKEALAGKTVGIAIGTTVACQLNNIPFYAKLRKGEIPDKAPLVSYVYGSPAEYIQRRLGVTGPVLTVSNACASGADAIGIAHLWLEQGLCDIAIAGGTDEINKVPYEGFNALGVCSDEPCRPFDKARSGLNLGEAAGIVIMKRGIAEGAQCAVAGFGKSSDAFHITQPEPEGRALETAMRNAMAGMPKGEELAFINAHGTGTQANDLVEAKVFGRMFGGKVPFMSTKALTGHTLGAAGAIEAIFTCFMLECGMAAASVRYSEKPDEFPVEPLKECLKLEKPHYALSTSLAFGGSNSALLIQRNQ